MNANDPFNNNKKENADIGDSILADLVWHEMQANHKGRCEFAGDKSLREEMLWQFVEKTIDVDNAKKIEAHLCQCRQCQAYVDRIKKSIQEADQAKKLTKNEAMVVAAKVQRQRMKTRFLRQLKDITQSTPASVQEYLKTVASQTNQMINNVFAYPAHKLEAVFGESDDFVVFSPYKKVRFPIRFRWKDFSQADIYQIAIEDSVSEEIVLEFETMDVEYILDRQTSRLEYGAKYLWELRIFSEKNIVRQMMGFFELASIEEHEKLQEIEQQLNQVDDLLNRYIVWANILETEGFIIEAIDSYIHAYEISPIPGIAFRIACCYDLLKLEGLRDEWNKRIPVEPPQGPSDLNGSEAEPGND